jgi:isopentenyl phosphate kinase
MLIFLKLGGSLITDKTRPYTPRLQKLDELVSEIESALQKHPDLRLVLGHGSGSFGHQAASQFDTRHGVSGRDAWRGFAEVWYQAATLNRLVVESLHRVGLPSVTISPFSTVTAHDSKVFIWDIFPLKTSLANGLVPIIHGDVVFDETRGGTILSTEDLFEHLGRELRPDRILLAGLEAGVWEDFPARVGLIHEITPEDFKSQVSHLGDAVGVDVTGGMQAKVSQMLTLVEEVEGLEVLIFSGEEPGNVLHALSGENPGTRLHR